MSSFVFPLWDAFLLFYRSNTVTELRDSHPDKEILSLLPNQPTERTSITSKDMGQRKRHRKDRRRLDRAIIHWLTTGLALLGRVDWSPCPSVCSPLGRFDYNYYSYLSDHGYREQKHQQSRGWRSDLSICPRVFSPLHYSIHRGDQDCTPAISICCTISHPSACQDGLSQPPPPLLV